MGGLASREQLRWSFGRWAMVTVPLMLLIGFAAGRSVPAGRDNGWYAARTKPPLTPPDWLFPVAWSVIYVLLGLAVATVIHARGARGRWPAVALFAVEIVALAAWQPLFFGLHRIWAALGLIGFILLCGIATAVLFGRVRDSVLKSTNNAQEPTTYGSIGGDDYVINPQAEGRFMLNDK